MSTAQLGADFWLPTDVDSSQARSLDTTDSFQAWAFRDQLKAVDPNRIDMIRTLLGCEWADGDRYLIVYKADTGVVSWFVIQDEHGEFCEPDTRHWDALMRYDQARSDRPLLERFRKERQMVAAAAEAQKEEERRHFREGLDERLAHIFDSSIPISARAKDLVDRAVSDEKARDHGRNHTLPKNNRKSL